MHKQNHSYAPAYAHDSLIEIFPNIYLLRGSIHMGFGLRMNRNMIVIKQNSDLTLINPVRMSTAGLNQLNQLGHVKNVIRLGDFHGLDDQFYIDTYQAHFWSQSNHTNYPELSPNTSINTSTVSPIHDSEIFIFETALYPEAALLIKSVKLLITTDSVQYWSDWKYMSFPTKIILWLMGFRVGLFLGGPWLKRVTPKDKNLESDFEQLLNLEFEHLVAAHGTVLMTNAKQQLMEVVKRTFSK